MLKILFFWPGMVLAALRAPIEHQALQTPNTASNRHAFLWKDDSLNILCNLNASLIYFYFERQTSAYLATKLLKGTNECGTAVITLKSKRDYKVSIVNDDGILMYMVLVIANAEQPLCLSHVKRQSGEKSKSYFIVLVENATNLDEKWLKTSFRKFWNLWILNAVIIFWRNELQVYSYSPFSTDHLLKLNSTDYRKEDLFLQHLPDLKGYPLRIAMHPERVRAVFNDKKEPIRGSDVFLMNLVVERLNATKVMVIPEDMQPGEVYSNGTGDGTIGLVIKNEADVSFNARFLVPYLFEDVLESTVVIGRDDLCVLVPRGGRVSHLLNIFKPFKINVWIMIFSVLIGVFVLLKILVPHETGLFLWLTGWSLNMPISRHPNTNLFRIFLIFWLTYAMLISGSYRGNLTSYLVAPNLRREINTMHDLLKSGYKLLLDQRYEHHLTKYRNTTFHRQITHMVLPVTTEFFNRHLSTNNLSFGYIDKWHIQFSRVNSIKHMHRGRFLFHLPKTCPIPFHIVYVVPHGSPFLGSFNRIIRYADETGLLLYWADHVETRRRMNDMRLAKKASRDKPRILRLYNIQAAFYLLLAGYCIALIAFLIEKYWMKLEDKFSKFTFRVQFLRLSRHENYEFVN